MGSFEKNTGGGLKKSGTMPKHLTFPSLARVCTRSGLSGRGETCDRESIWGGKVGKREIKLNPALTKAIKSLFLEAFHNSREKTGMVCRGQWDQGKVRGEVRKGTSWTRNTRC